MRYLENEKSFFKNLKTDFHHFENCFIWEIIIFYAGIPLSSREILFFHNCKMGCAILTDYIPGLLNFMQFSQYTIHLSLKLNILDFRIIIFCLALFPNTMEPP